MQKKELVIASGVTCCMAFFGTLFLPECRLVAFAPLLAYLLRKFSLLSLFWWAIAMGIIADSTSIHYRFGLSSAAYLVAVGTLYPTRRHFFEDKPFPFAMLCYFVSCIVGVFFTLASLYKGTIHFLSFWGFAREIFLTPAIDALMGLALVFVPIKAYIKKKDLKNPSPEEA